MPDQPELRQRLVDFFHGREIHPFNEFADFFSLCEEDAQDFADLLLSLPGIAMVELPEPNGAKAWPVLVDGEPESIYLTTLAGEKRAVISGFGGLYFDEIRPVAAALLAAADAAEAQTHA